MRYLGQWELYEALQASNAPEKAIGQKDYYNKYEGPNSIQDSKFPVNQGQIYQQQPAAPPANFCLSPPTPSTRTLP